MKKIIIILIAIYIFFVSSFVSFSHEPIRQKYIGIKKEDSHVLDVEPDLDVSEEDIIVEKQYEFCSKLNEIKQIESNKERFEEYKRLACEYEEWVDLPETVFDTFTDEEIYLICRVVETECYQQDFDSKVNVANVIFNRYYDGRFGDTITDIITSPKQFVYGRKNIEDDTMLAVQYAYECNDTTQGALYFHSFENASSAFSGAEYIFSDNAVHHFFR